MRVVLPCFRKRRTRSCLWIGALFVVIALVNWGIRMGIFTGRPAYALAESRKHVLTSETFFTWIKSNIDIVVHYRRLRAQFPEIIHHVKTEYPKYVLTSQTYTSNKTEFDDAFPPNTPTVLTLERGYIIGNFNVCKEAIQLTYIVVVHSAFMNEERRDTIRSTWGKRNLLPGISSRTIFLLGRFDDSSAKDRTDDKPAQDAVVRENERHGDIVQGDFLDTYYNLTLKAVMGLRWLWDHCPNVQFVVKVDDDVVVDMFKASDMYFSNLESSPRQIICYVSPHDPVFRGEWSEVNKWTIPDDFFKGYEYYPMPFCHGFVVFMSMTLVRDLYQVARFTPTYRLDDVYCAILSSKVKGSSWRDESRRFSLKAMETSARWGCRKEESLVAGVYVTKREAKLLWEKTLTCM